MKESHKFWSTQPVPQMDEKPVGNEPIEADKPLSEIRAEPYTLPEGFVWDSLDLNEPLVLKELYTLLNENYVEDDDAMFRFDYQPEFLKWALQPPGWLRVNDLFPPHHRRRGCWCSLNNCLFYSSFLGLALWSTSGKVGPISGLYIGNPGNVGCVRQGDKNG